MSQYLVFQLHGPMASWGVDAPGEVRHSHELPSRSALLGLLAAALGIRRDEEERLKNFNQHYSFLLCASKNPAGRGIITPFKCQKRCEKPVILAAAKS
jgi:CRISPR system Cascade subunit CasD